MKRTNIALLQAFLALMVIIANASLHTMALIELNKMASLKPTDNGYAQIQNCKKILLIAIFVQFVAAVIMIAVSIVIIANKKSLDKHMSKLIYFALFLSGMLMLASGVIGAYVSSQLQCFKYLNHVDKAWNYTVYTAVIGILGVIVILITQAFIRRSSIKAATLRYLGAAALPPPPKYDVFTGKLKAEMRSGCALDGKCIERGWHGAKMPTYHPSVQRRMSDLSV